MIVPHENVYGDRTVLINDLYIKIYKYYFPLATSKTIMFEEIDHIIYYPGEKVNLAWGMPFDHMNDWFPLDGIRDQKKGYFQIVMKNNSFRPCFSPDEPERAFRVIWFNHSLQGNKWKLQSLKEANPPVLLSPKLENVEKAYDSRKIEINSIKNEKYPLQENEISTAKIKQGQKQRTIFADLTNQSFGNDNKFQKRQKLLGDALSPIRYLNFEEEEEQSQKSKQKNLIRETNIDTEFQDLS